MKETTKNTPDRLASYLAAAGIGGLAATAEAAVVQLDVSTISGVNAGLAPGGSKLDGSLGSLGSGLEGSFGLYHQSAAKYEPKPLLTGLVFKSEAMMATGNGATSPTNFSTGTLIGSDAQFKSTKYNTLFASGSNVSPDFGPDSFIGFKSADGHYGWLEVTWDSSIGNFEILDGAYENVEGVAIQAGVSAVPEPAGALGTLGLLAGGIFVRRRRLAA
jgi:hypothetical protein